MPSNDDVLVRHVAALNVDDGVDEVMNEETATRKSARVEITIIAKNPRRASLRLIWDEAGEPKRGPGMIVYREELQRALDAL